VGASSFVVLNPSSLKYSAKIERVNSASLMALEPPLFSIYLFPAKFNCTLCANISLAEGLFSNNSSQEFFQSSPNLNYSYLPYSSYKNCSYSSVGRFLNFCVSLVKYDGVTYD
jgi:hypothetical protein